MKLKAITRLIKDNKFIYTVEESSDSFWLGNGTAIYLVDGLPLMTNEQLLVMFEVPEKEYSKYQFSNNLKFTDQIERKDCIEAESIAKMLGMSLYYCGYTLVLLKTEAGLVCIDEKYLKPLSDLKRGYYLYLRYTDDNKPYIVAKEGMFLRAVIMPCNIIDKYFRANIAKVMKLTDIALGNAVAETAEAESFLHGE